MNNVIYYKNKYPQDYGILYINTPESGFASIDKASDYKKGIRIYGLISCIGVFIIPSPNTLIGGHFSDERDIDFLTKMDKIIMDCNNQGLIYLFYRNTTVSGQLNDINTNKNFLKNRYKNFIKNIIEINVDRSYVNVTFMEFIDEINWENIHNEIFY